jgi:hypothetical protein
MTHKQSTPLGRAEIHAAFLRAVLAVDHAEGWRSARESQADPTAGAPSTDAAAEGPGPASEKRES